MDIGKLIANTQKLNFSSIVEEALVDNKESLVELQKKQFLSGQAADGRKIGRYKDKRYRIKKFNMNPLAGYGNVDLKLTGMFYSRIKIYFFSKAFFFKSTDYKNPILENKYGDFWGLSPKSTSTASKELVRPVATKKIIEQIHRV